MPSTPLLKSKFFWVGILYFSQGFPFGVFYDVLPVYFRQQGVDLREIGLLSLLGLAWTIKFLWAPAVDHYRHHRRWMAGADLAMGALLLFLAAEAGVGTHVWVAIGIFTLLSATNDIAIDGYTIELFDKQELGMVNGIRIAFGRVGILAAGAILIVSDILSWPGAFALAGGLIGLFGIVCLAAPKERDSLISVKPVTLVAELKGLFRRPKATVAVLGLFLGTLWLVNNVTRWSAQTPYFWATALLLAGLVFAASGFYAARKGQSRKSKTAPALTQGPMFGALMEMLQRRHILPVIGFVLLFKLGDASMGFMVKPFWVDAGFSATQIGLVSVNMGLVLSIAGGVAGGWFTDRVGIFRALWILGLFQALSNLGYVWAASAIPLAAPGTPVVFEQQMIIYSASALESFTGGLGTAAFLAFLMAIVNQQHSATEYALLSSVFALSRQLAGYASGFGAHYMGYAPYFLLTFFLSFPAYLLLPWAKKMLTADSTART